MATVRRSGAWLLAALALVATAAIAVAQESSPAGPAPRLVVFEDFTRFT